MLLARALAAWDDRSGKWGRIVHTSSVMAFASNPGRGLYSATKAALIAMARAHALGTGPLWHHRQLPGSRTGHDRSAHEPAE